MDKETATIVSKHLLLKQFREMSPFEIQKVAPEFTYEDDKFIEIDWEFAFFDASLHQIQKVISHFAKKQDK